MPAACILLYAASVAAPLVLFAVLIWNGIERRLATAAHERFVRERRMPAPAATVLMLPRLAPIVIRPSDRHVA
jgi:hypothetical protein